MFYKTDYFVHNRPAAEQKKRNQMKTSKNGLRLTRNVPNDESGQGGTKELASESLEPGSEEAEPAQDDRRQIGPWERVFLVFLFLLVVLYLASVVMMIVAGPPYPDPGTPRFPDAWGQPH
jgi:hypothetical protein